MPATHILQREQRIELPIAEADRDGYAIPFGPLGGIADRVLVRRDLRQIFDYRRDAVARELGGVAP